MFDCSLFRCEDNTDGKVATYIPQLARFQIDYTVSEIKKTAGIQLKMNQVMRKDDFQVHV